jgi:hypothetical protein
VNATGAGSLLQIFGEAGDDRIQVRAMAGEVRVFGGDDADVVTVSDVAPIRPTSLPTAQIGSIGFIDGRLLVDGQGGSDTLYVDDSRAEHVNDKQGTLTSSTLRGLELPVGTTTPASSRSRSGSATATTSSRSPRRTQAAPRSTRPSAPTGSRFGASRSHGRLRRAGRRPRVRRQPGRPHGYRRRRAQFLNLGGNVNGIGAVLTVRGGDTGELDRLHVDETERRSATRASSPRRRSPASAWAAHRLLRDGGRPRRPRQRRRRLHDPQHARRAGAHDHGRGPRRRDQLNVRSIDGPTTVAGDGLVPVIVRLDQPVDRPATT